MISVRQVDICQKAAAENGNLLLEVRGVAHLSLQRECVCLTFVSFCSGGASCS